MENSIFTIPEPANEPVFSYKPKSQERNLLLQELERQSKEIIEIPLIIGSKEIKTGDIGKAVMPHDHAHTLATFHKAGEREIRMAIEAALEIKRDWENLPWIERATIALKAAELISTKYRYILNAATMLNQSKNVYQAEIDSTCELADFLRFNAHYMSQIYQSQPLSSSGILNRMDYRPLEGFVFAVTPFNFTAIAGNLPSAPAIMGNTVLWKPASNAVLSGFHMMKLFKEAGFPDGVINFIPGSGAAIGDIVLGDENLAGVHFTGSTDVFQRMWKTIGACIPTYKSYPRIVGETGGKDFIFAHESADVEPLITALVRGAFEYQGQKCSAASRAYIPKSLWASVKEKLDVVLRDVKTGDPRDFSNFVNALIDEKAFDNAMSYLKKVEESKDAEIIFGGDGDKSKGYFLQPTVIEVRKPDFVTMVEEIFAPVLSVYVYEDNRYEETLELCNKTSPYGLTGAVFATDRKAVVLASEILRHAAGNFYINDKPTGAVVGQQPFGGARASGTNDKAGSWLNLLRWTSARTIKENFCPPEDFRYPFMD
jgi:1-pyrroline-5-carboxylate dehydrogenase